MSETTQQLQIKSYFVSSVEMAMEMARQELGPEALLLKTGDAPAEARHLGAYEVVFAVPPAEAAPAAQPDPYQLLHRELVELRKQIREIASPARNLPRELAEIHAALTEAGVAAELAQDIVQSLRRVVKPLSLEQQLRAELERRFQVDSGLARIVALVGPPGGGKTTTLVKLALRYGLTARRPVHFISMDTCRVGAAAQLQSYAAILDAGFEALETSRALSQALEEHRGKGLILIDTAGYSPWNLEDAADLAGYLAGNPDIETHLALPAWMKSEDLARAAERFEIFRPARLLFTRMDETCSAGSVFCEAARSGKPLSFLGTGPSIPEDLEAATKPRVMESLLEGRLARIASVA